MDWHKRWGPVTTLDIFLFVGLGLAIVAFGWLVVLMTTGGAE